MTPVNPAIQCEFAAGECRTVSVALVKLFSHPNLRIRMCRHHVDVVVAHGTGTVTQDNIDWGPCT